LDCLIMLMLITGLIYSSPRKWNHDIVEKGVHAGPILRNWSFSSFYMYIIKLVSPISFLTKGFMAENEKKSNHVQQGLPSASVEMLYVHSSSLHTYLLCLALSTQNDWTSFIFIYLTCFGFCQLNLFMTLHQF
jgi:hypothetical protein